MALGAAGAGLAAPARYESPEAALAAVVAALEARDRDALIAVFGPQAEDVILTGEDAADREAWRQFLALSRDAAVFETEGDAVTLYLGAQLWPFPAPLTRNDAGWAFDADAAREEVFLRRIGGNELDVIELMGLYVAVQAAYRLDDHDGDGVMAFAASIDSAPGEKDGLHWNGPDSPVGDLLAGADAGAAEPEPFHGYVYRILTGQGDAAPGGAMDYRVNGAMLAGHALLAYPYAYGETGIMSFMVAENGVVYEADLGPDTDTLAGAITQFNPGEGWAPVAE